MSNPAPKGPGTRTIDLVNASLKRRYAQEQRFKLFGLGAVLLGLFFVSLLFLTILGNGLPAFMQTQIRLDIAFDEQVIDPSGNRDPEELARADYMALIKTALRERFPNVNGRNEKRELYSIISGGAPIRLQNMIMEHPELIGTRQQVWMLADDEVDMLKKGRVTKTAAIAGTGIASVVTDGDQVNILSTSNDFAPILAEIKRALMRKADKTQEEVDLSESRLARVQSERAELLKNIESLAPTADPERVSRLEERLADVQRDIDSLVAVRATLTDKLTELRRRADQPGGAELLTAELPSYLVRINGGVIKIAGVQDTQVTGKAVLPLQSADDAAVGSWEILAYVTPEADRRVKDSVVTWVRALEDSGAVEKRFNTTFFTAGDSREPEQAGIGGAVAGSFFTLLVTLALSFPIGVAAALYLEEFAPKNRWTDLIEVNINNLAAVPSIVFGLLGLAVFINFFGLPRSAPLVGGLVLTLMTLPTIIIASRAALKSVPPSIREAALGVGASKLQTMFHHVLPLAMPGMLTGTIIGMAQALGETAPLLMIGMVAFIVDIPGGPLDPSAVLPVQIFLWADSPERAFVEKTSAAIIVLLAFLIVMNALAVILRKRFERRW